MDTTAVNGPEDVLDWDAIDWRAHEDNVARLRRRIFTATRKQDWARVRSLQKMMLRSWSNTLVSVRQVTQHNAGRRTAGVDGEVALSSPERRGWRCGCTARARPGIRGRSDACTSRRPMENSAHSAFRRTPHTARSRRSGEVSESFVTVTHPFHPLAGQRLRVLFERRYQAGGLALCCEGGSLGTVMLPVDWTDRGTPAASGVVGFEELIELAALVRALATRQE